MKPVPDDSSPADESPPAGATPALPGLEEPPGVPGFHTWRGIYAFVFGWFVLVVVLLALFSRWFA